jgi:hypothetical protein
MKTKRNYFFSTLFIFAFILVAWKNYNPPSEKIITTINSVKVYHDTITGDVYFTAGMNIDADGSPFAYHPVSDSGLDALANAGHKGNWWGIITDKNGDPILQGKNDPAPGFYVSCTSLQDTTKKISDPRRYMNSDSVFYVVVPNNKAILSHIKIGDVGVVRNMRNWHYAFVIVADIGPADKIGEGSIRLANWLGIPSSPRKGGVADSVKYLLFPKSGLGKPLPLWMIDSIADGRDY